MDGILTVQGGIIKVEIHMKYWNKYCPERKNCDKRKISRFWLAGGWQEIFAQMKPSGKNYKWSFLSITKSGDDKKDWLLFYQL